MTERVQFKLMIPADLKEALENAAHESRRSLSAEIIHRLNASIETDNWNKMAAADIATALKDEDAVKFLASINAKYETLIAEAHAAHRKYTAAMNELLKQAGKT